MTLKERNYEFKPPVLMWDVDDLIFVANDDTGYWSKKAIKQARKELYRRGLPDEYEQQIIGNEDKRRLFEEKMNNLYDRQLQDNELEDYKTDEKIVIFLAAPVILLGKWHFGDPLSVLNSLNYKLKYRRRAFLLTLGAFIWIIIALLFMLASR